MKVYNTLSRTIEEVIPIDGKTIKMYNCGPTVYDYAQIGNWRAYIFVDVLKRTLLMHGYELMQVMNITDVGHLTSDEDIGEDKIEKGAKREKKTVWEVAQYYLDDFLASRDILHILPPDVLCRATDHIAEQIEMIQKLIDQEHAYVTSEAVYFDVTTFPTYSVLSGQKIEEKSVGVREEVRTDPLKKHQQDFRLWQLDRPDHQMIWDSPWGKGFPGWHIECSAMSVAYLGQPFDIHTGGVDHIPVHHTNEIAQAESANGKTFVNIWMHNEFVTIAGHKMSKSQRNSYTLQDIQEMIHGGLQYESKNSAIALRYLFLTSHYRNKMDFSPESLFAAFQACFELYKAFATFSLDESEILNTLQSDPVPDIALKQEDNPYIHKLYERSGDDLDTPALLANLFLLIKDTTILDRDKLKIMAEYDKILGLGFIQNTKKNIFDFSDDEKVLIEGRNSARKDKNFARSDEIRNELERYGVVVMDEKDRTLYFKK